MLRSTRAGGVLDGISGKVRASGGSLNLRVTDELADHR